MNCLSILSLEQNYCSANNSVLVLVGLVTLCLLLVQLSLAFSIVIVSVIPFDLVEISALIAFIRHCDGDLLFACLVLFFAASM